jgi:hypothetical protein
MAGNITEPATAVIELGLADDLKVYEHRTEHAKAFPRPSFGYLLPHRKW